MKHQAVDTENISIQQSFQIFYCISKYSVLNLLIISMLAVAAGSAGAIELQRNAPDVHMHLKVVLRVMFCCIFAKCWRFEDRRCCCSFDAELMFTRCGLLVWEGGTRAHSSRNHHHDVSSPVEQGERLDFLDYRWYSGDLSRVFACLWDQEVPPGWTTGRATTGRWF